MYIVSTIRLGSTKICIYITTKKPPILLSLMLDSYWFCNSSHNSVKYLTLRRMHFQTLYFWFYNIAQKDQKTIAIILTDFLPKASDDTNIKLTSLPGLLSFSYTHETKTHILIAIISLFVSAQENIELTISEVKQKMEPFDPNEKSCSLK